VKERRKSENENNQSDRCKEKVRRGKDAEIEKSRIYLGENKK